MIEVTANVQPLFQLGTGDFLHYAIVSFVLAPIAAGVGLRGVAGISMEIAPIMMLIFMVLMLVAIIL